MPLSTFEQTGAYHTKAADLAFMNGDVNKAISHLEAAFYAAKNNRQLYLSVVNNTFIERYDQEYPQAARPEILIA